MLNELTGLTFYFEHESIISAQITHIFKDSDFLKLRMINEQNTYSSTLKIFGLSTHYVTSPIFIAQLGLTAT